ncbi:8926_t:CDS:2, partial [Dentiscutata erythropus]
MSQQNDQQNQSPNSNLSSSQTANANNNTTNDQFSNFQKSSQQTQQITAQNQQSSLQQPQTSQTTTTPQLQPATSQPSQVSVTVPVRPVSVSTKGGNAKKKTGGSKKASGSRPKTASTEKNDDSMLPQALSQMATDYYNQATQHGGQNTPEGQLYLKKYMDTVQALEQHQRNNQHASFSFVPPASQITSPATTPSPNQMSRIPATMPSVPSPMHNHQNNPQIVARPQQHQHQQHMVGRGPPINYQQLTAPRVTNPTSGPSQTTYTTRPYNIRPQQMISPIPDSQRMMTINTHGHSGATGSPTTQPIQSPIIPSSPLTNNIAEGSMITTMQPQTIHQSPRLHQQTQSPGSQPPPQSPRQPLSQSPRPHHQIQPLPQSPRTQHLSQLSQTQQTHLNSHVTNPLMEIDSVQTTIIPKPITDGIRQITPIAPANPSGLPSPLPQHLSVTNKLQIPGVKMHTIPNLGMNLPETPASLEQEEIDKHPLSKRKIQQLVDQIDPKERLEPEVEDNNCPPNLPKFDSSFGFSFSHINVSVIYLYFQMLLEIADEFITSVSSFACLLAKHRKSDTLEVKDLQLHLERNWNIRIPGFASDEIRSVRKTIVPSSHQQKMLANLRDPNALVQHLTESKQFSEVQLECNDLYPSQFDFIFVCIESFKRLRFHETLRYKKPVSYNLQYYTTSRISRVVCIGAITLRARFPTEGDIKKFDILDKLFANIPLAQDWRNPFNYSKAGLLTDRGEHELYLLGKRARQRYYEFWNNLTYDSNVVVFQSSAVS